MNKVSRKEVEDFFDESKWDCDDDYEEYTLYSLNDDYSVQVKLYKEHDCFDIYYVLPYSEVEDKTKITSFHDLISSDELKDNLSLDIYSYWLNRELTKQFHSEPSLGADDCGFGSCPDDTLWLGYFSCSFSEVKSFIDLFLCAVRVADEISSNSSNNYAKAIHTVAHDTLINMGCSFDGGKYKYTNHLSRIFSKISFSVSVNTQETAAFCNPLNNVFIGKDCFYLQNDTNVYYFDKIILNGLASLSETFYWKKEVKVFFVEKNLIDEEKILLSNGLFNVSVDIHIDIPTVITNPIGIEFARLQEECKSILSFLNEGMKNEIRTIFNFENANKTKPINFSHLNAEQFENLCFDCLHKMGFIEIHPVGKTNAPDGGKDLFATEEYNTLLGTEKRIWIWQCKHTPKSLDRKDVAEIDDLLKENNANAYGLFCSNDLTPDAINRLMQKKEKSKISLTYFAKCELAAFLTSSEDIIEKYDLRCTT